jgi:hypothetical protein
MNGACRNVRELIDDALDGRLDAEARGSFDAHVGACGACAAEWDLATSLRTSLLQVGLDRAPSDLRDSIAAGVRLAAAPPVTRPRAAPPLGAPYLRAAAGVLLVVAVGWLVIELRRTQPPVGHLEAEAGRQGAVAPAKDASPAPAARPSDAVAVNVVWNAELQAPPVLDGLSLVAAPEAASGLVAAREIATGGPGAVDELNRVVSAGATPEERRRQAEVLVLLDENLPALADAAGEAEGLSKLGIDADATLRDFSGARAARDDRKQLAPEEALEKESAMKVARADAPPGPKPDAAAPRGGRAPSGKAATPPPPRSPALYVLSGPGVIGRVETLLADRRLAFHRVSLSERSDNERKRKLEERDAGYAILEVELLEDAIPSLVGDLESLSGLKLAPVGTQAGWGPEPGGETRARKGLPARKLRLVLIPR